MRVLIIGYVWPEPSSSAAGRHILSIAKLLRLDGSEICFASAAEPTEHVADLAALGITRQQIELNSASFDQFLQRLDPELVVFDRFMTEEQFGWRVQRQCPQAIRILDTEDLQSLREERRRCVLNEEQFDPLLLRRSEKFKRELAAIHRCDLSLIISPVEYQLLLQDFAVPATHLCLLPFIVDENELRYRAGNLADRDGAVAIGNFRHAPNWDSVLELFRLWPSIRAKVPQAAVRIYGAYLPPKAMQLHQPKNGFHVLGRAENALATLQSARVLVAPLRFGAGLKGKLLEAAIAKTPSVTTPIGAEGMLIDDVNWPGVVANNDEEFITATASLLTDDDALLRQQQLCQPFVSQYENTRWSTLVLASLTAIRELGVEQHREGNMVGLLMNYHGAKSYQYMSQWIQLKGEFAAFKNALE